MAKRRGRNSRGVGNKEKDDKEKDEEKEKDKETDGTPKLAVVGFQIFGLGPPLVTSPVQLPSGNQT
jgi:hypothetical protein